MRLVCLPLLVLAACGGDTSITKRNDAPTATIAAPLDGAGFVEGDVVLFQGLVQDTDDGVDDLVATWFSGAEEICAAAPVADDGVTSCEVAVGPADTTILLEARDPDFATGFASIDLVVGVTGAPEVELTAPDGDGPWYADHDVIVGALVSDAEDAPTDLVLIWTDADGAEIDVGATVAEDGTVTGAFPFAEGPHAVTLTAVDTSGKTASTTVAFVVGGPNTAPECVITAPSGLLVAAAGETVSFAGTVIDADVPEDWLLGEWSSDLDGVLGAGAADVDGNVALDTSALSLGSHVVTLTGADEVGATCTATVQVDVTGPPSIDIDLPVDGDVYNEGDVIAFAATLSDDLTLPEDLVLSWESDVDGVIDTTPADTSGVASFSAAWLSVGAHTLTLSATDGSGLTSTATASFVVNGLPGAPTVTIEPGAADGDDDLVATVLVEADDPEADPLTYTYAWYVDGAPSGYTGATVPASATTRGEVWEVYVTPNDGYGDGVSGTAAVTIGNTAPTLAGVTLSPDPAYEGDTLACAPGVAVDGDGDAVAYTYAWTVAGVGVAETGATLADTWWAHGDAVVCTVTPDDGVTAGTAVSSAPVVIANTAPRIDAVAITPEAPAAEDTLTCTATGFLDADGDADLSVTTWTVDGAPAGTGSTLATGFTGGSVVACTVTPYDGMDAGTPFTASVTVDNTPPVLADVTLTPESPTEADTLVCTPGVTTDADGATSFSYSFRWIVGGATIGATGATLDASAFAKGDVVMCAVVPDDGTSAGAEVASNAVTVADTPPQVTSVTLTPSAPGTDDTITATVTGADLDGDAVSYRYAWYVDGAPVGGSTATLAGASFDSGDTVYVVVTPDDGELEGAPYTSASVVIANTAPVLTGVTLTPDSATETSTLTCTPTASDVDGDTLSYTYAWYVDGAAIAATSSTLTGASFARGDDVYCQVTPTDGTEAGTALASNTVTIDNTAPALASVTLTPTSATEASTLTCTPSASDVDGDTVSYTYAWFVNGGAVGSTSSTLTGSSFGGGDTVYCRVTPTDGTDAGTAMASNTVTIGNTAPVLSSVTLTPESATEASTLTCTPSATDADGDTISYTYAWYVDGVVVGSTSSTLTGASFAHGDDVYCRVTPTDGADVGTAMSSNTVTIGNTAPVLASVTLTPTSATEASTLTCTPSATDVDGDTISYTYAWFVDGAAVGSTSSTLTSASFARGDDVYCRVTPSDGDDAGTAMASNTVTIDNTAPLLASVTLTPTAATEASTLTCTPSASDVDGDTVSYGYAWYVNGAAIAATSSTLTGSSFGGGDTVYCRVTPTDGTDAGTAMSSNIVTIENTAPVLSSVTLTPTSATEASTLTCTPSATDVDGDTVSYAYAWYVDGSAIAATSSTLTGSSFEKGDDVYCRVTPTDGADAGTAMASNTVTIGNTAPALASVTLTPTSATEASTLTCTPSATDVDGDTVSYTYAWYVDGAAIAATSSTLAGASFGRGDDVYCRVTPTDGATSGTAMASNTVTIGNTAPVLASVTLTPTAATEASTLTCTPSASDVDGDTVSYGYAWYVNGAAIAATSSTLTGASFGGGDTVYCRVTPTDGTTSGTAMSSNTVTIENTAPVLSSVTLTPTTAYESSTLTCEPSATDADGDTVSYTYAWYVNGSAIAATSSTLTGSSFAKGNTVYCRVTPTDGTASGTAMTSNTVTISNSAPVASSVTLTPTSATEASTLTCTPSATDADGDTVSYTYAWYVNSVAIAATSSTLTGSSFAKGNTVYCRVTPTDGSTSGTAVSSNTVTISNTAPVLSSVTLTPTTATESSTLTCTPSASDVDGDTVSYGYAWYVNGAAIAATSSTLTGSSFGGGDTVYCRVTPTDGTTSGTAMSSNTVTIENTAPVLSSVTLTPTTAYESSTLTCTPSATDADGDTVSYTYAWYVNGSAIAATSSTLTGSSFAKGNTVYCRVTPTDGTTSGTAMVSNTVTISNTAPVASSVTLTPTTAYESSTLTCTPSATDADGDTVSYTYAWYVNSVAIAATSSTLTGSTFAKGNTVYCRVTPTDGSTSGTAVSSNTVTISNTAPVLSSVTLTPTTAYESSTLTCAPSATDADGDTVSYTYAWYVNGSAIAATSSTLTGTYFGGGNTVYCRVTPTDGTTSGTAMSSNTVTISNTAPVLSSVTLTPTTAYESSTLTCTPSATDADGDTVSYAYAWYVNSVAIAPTSSTLTGSSFAKGNTVYCRVTPNDGTASGTAMTSNTVTISNTAPALSSVTLTPTTAYESSTLTCTPSATDADGDSVSYTYAWYVNSVAIAPTSSTLTGTYFAKGNTVYCRVTPTDGATSGTAVNSNTVTISNTAPVLSSVTLTPTSATESSTLTCTPSATDADGDTVSYTYAWYVNGSAIAPTSSTLTGTYFSRTNTVYCRVTPRDAAGSGTAMSSNVVTIGNTAPTAPVLAIDPTAPIAGLDDLLCEVVTASSDADGESVSYDITWTVDGAPYPGSFPGAVGPDTTIWPDDTVPAEDTVLGADWTCTAVPFDATADGPSATASVTVEDTGCYGVPVGPVCSGETVSVAYVPGWATSHTGSSSLVFATLESTSLTYGDCTIDFTSVGSGFTLATLSAYDVVFISDPSGGSRLYTAGEQAAIRDYLEGGYGGVVGTFLLKYLDKDNTGLMDLFGVDATGLTDGSSAAATGGTVVDASHPVADALPGTFTLLGYGQEQSNAGGWTSDDLLECASFVVDASGQSSVIANDDYNWRAVYFTGMPEFNNPGADSRQALYNALLWAAGYQ